MKTYQMKDYPDDKDLELIEKWDVINDISGLLQFLESMMWMPDWCFELKGKRILKLQLHTGGWSGNEDIIRSLKMNTLFWACHWVMSRRGGHHYFEIKLKSK
jgi:hypothetical protein